MAILQRGRERIKSPPTGPEIQSAAAIAPATVAGVALIRCGCSEAAWVIEIFAAVILALWVFRAKP